MSSIVALISKINFTYTRFSETKSKATKEAIETGVYLNELKPKIKGEGENWANYVETTFPFIGIRRVQQFMQVARAVKEDYAPIIEFLGVDNLVKLARLCHEESIDDFLERNEIEVNIKNSSGNIISFKKQVELLLSSQSKNKRDCREKIAAKQNLTDTRTSIDVSSADTVSSGKELNIITKQKLNRIKKQLLKLTEELDQLMSE